jgi:hypothetical protein
MHANLRNYGSRQAGDPTTDSDDSPLIDKGMERGFGGFAGANRCCDGDELCEHAETLPKSKATTYGTEPGRSKEFGSIGQDTKPATQLVAKARLAMKGE